MSSIIKLVYGSEIKREIVEGKYHQTTSTTRLRETVNAIFEKNKWQPDLFASLKKSAIKSILKKMISEQKAQNLPVLFKKAEELMQESKLKHPLMPEQIHQLCKTLHKEFATYPEFEISYLLRNQSAVKKYLVHHHIITSKDGSIEVHEKYNKAQLQKMYDVMHTSSVATQNEVSEETKCLATVIAEKGYADRIAEKGIDDRIKIKKQRLERLDREIHKKMLFESVAKTPYRDVLSEIQRMDPTALSLQPQRDEELDRKTYRTLLSKSAVKMSYEEILSEIQRMDPTLSLYPMYLRLCSFEKDRSRQQSQPNIMKPGTEINHIPTLYPENISDSSAKRIAHFLSFIASSKDANKIEERLKALTSIDRLDILFLHQLTANNPSLRKVNFEQAAGYLPTRNQAGLDAKILKTLLELEENPIFIQIFEKETMNILQNLENHVCKQDYHEEFAQDMHRGSKKISLSENSTVLISGTFDRDAHNNSPIELFSLGQANPKKIDPLKSDINFESLREEHLKNFASDLNKFAQNDSSLFTILQGLLTQTFQNLITRKTLAAVAKSFGIPEGDSSMLGFYVELNPQKKTFKYLSEHRIQASYEIEIVIKTVAVNSDKKAISKLSGISIVIDKKNGVWECSPSFKELINTLIKLRQIHQEIVNEEEKAKAKLQDVKGQLKKDKGNSVLREQHLLLANKLFLLVEEGKWLTKQYAQEFKKLSPNLQALHDNYVAESMDQTAESVLAEMTNEKKRGNLYANSKHIDHELIALQRMKTS